MDDMLTFAVRNRVALIAAAVLLPRLAWFVLLGGSLPAPDRDQRFYLRLADSFSAGDGLSFSEETAWYKSLFREDTFVAENWSGESGYLFGIVPAGEPTAAIEPGYPVLLGLLFLLTGPVTGAVFLLNCAAALLGAWAVWKLVSDGWGEAAGMTAALAWSVYPYFVYYSAYAMTDSLHISLLPILLWLTIRACTTGRGGFSAGAASGILFLFRSTVLFIVPVQVAYLLLRKRWRASVALTAAFAACCMPWVVRNQIELGAPVLLPTKGSLNLWMRNNPEALAIEGQVIPDWIMDGLRRPELMAYPSMEGLETELERSDALSSTAAQFMLANPVLIAYLSARRFLEFMSPVGGTMGGLGPALAGFVTYLPLLVASVLETLKRKRDGRVLFLAAVFATYAAMHSLSHGGVRYRLPVDTVLIILATLFASRRLRWKGAEDA
jgi:hypothetical protein